jgi:anti-anti-sigma factor
VADAMSHSTFAMGSDVTISQAASLRDALLARLAQAPRTLTLDMSEVTEVDSAGAQLLLATRTALSRAGGRLVIEPVSPTVRHGLALVGLAHLLNPTAEDTP